MKSKFSQNHIYISTYHFIRNSRDRFYKNINFLDYSKFKIQINYFKRMFNLINFEDTIDILNSKRKYKKPFMLLTFDDGYRDHYKYVFPFLKKEKIQGLFYPFANIKRKAFITDTNKIHFILAKLRNTDILENEIVRFLKKRTNYDLTKFELLKQKTYENRRYDNEKVSYVKAILQYYLPQKIRKNLNDYLFQKYVSKEKEFFSKKLYMNLDEIKEMKSFGMHFGSHGTSHNFLGLMSKKKQKEELNQSLNFLKKLFPLENNFSICYPYGSYNKDTIKISKELNFRIGFTNKFGSINLKKKVSFLTLPRFDTNDFK